MLKKEKEEKEQVIQQNMQTILTNQDFYEDLEEVFEPVTKQKNAKQTLIKGESLKNRKPNSTKKSWYRKPNTTNKTWHQKPKIFYKTRTFEQGSEVTKTLTMGSQKQSHPITNLVKSNTFSSDMIVVLSKSITPTKKYQFSIPYLGKNHFTINSIFSELITIIVSKMVFTKRLEYDSTNTELANFITETSI